jgi:hypothetical protein
VEEGTLTSRRIVGHHLKRMAACTGGMEWAVAVRICHSPVGGFLVGHFLLHRSAVVPPRVPELAG